MIARWASAALVVTIAAAGLHASPAAPPAELTVREFAEALDAIEVQLSALDPAQPGRASGIAAEIPRSWIVVAGDRRFEVPGLWLRAELASWIAHPDRTAQKALVAHVSTLRRDALGYDTAGADDASMRASLERILSAHEFAGVSGPSWWARLKARILRWLEQLVLHALGSSAVPIVTNALIYVLAVLAVVVIFVSIQRQLRRRASLDPKFQPPAAVPSDRPWPIWMQDAHTASADGRWRDAIHFAYWGGISFLESQQAWQPDASRTPREYTRAFAETGARADALKQFTTLLERVWYAGESADADGYSAALAHLGALGCPSQ